MREDRIVPLLLLFVSGAVAVAFEVLWLRGFIALLGATAPAVAATLSGVFLGFAVGSRIGAGLARRPAKAWRTYGLLEIVAALASALAFPGFTRGETFVAAPLVFLATVCMGATLPVLAAARGRAGVSDLYGANLAGAVAGALAVPFLLLPAFGVQGSSLLVAAVGASAGAVALARTGRRAASAAPPSPPQVVGDPGDALRGMLGLSFLSGFVLLALETLFTRLFAQVHESSVSAFAVVVAVFLAALAAGAGLARPDLLRKWSGAKRLVIAWTLAAAFAAAIPLCFAPLTGGLEAIDVSRWSGRCALLGLACLVVGPVVATAGVGFPWLLRAATSAGGGARAVARLLAANALGSILGPLAATFLLAPLFGTARSAALLGALLAFAAAAAAAAFRGRALAACGGLVALAVFAFAEPLRVRLDAGRGETLVALTEGAHGVVAVVRDAAGMRIKVDNHYVLGGTAAAGDLRQLAHLPLLLHPEPRRVAFLGMGTGITAGAAVAHPVESIDVVELMPEVVAAAHAHFGAASQGLFTDPRVHVVEGDARIFLEQHARAFDVVVGDLVVPWRAGESALYTREHFERARASLRPGGLFCQWLPAYQLTVEQFDAIAATFLDAFPRASLWRGDFVAGLPTLGLVGHDRDVVREQVDARVRALVPQLDAASPYLMDPAGPWLYLIGTLDPAAPRWRAARRHTLDRPWVELAGPGDARAGGASARLTGAPLDLLIDEVGGASAPAGAPIRLGEPEATWRAAGRELWRASSLVFDGKGDEGRRLALATFARLPAPLREAVVGKR